MRVSRVITAVAVAAALTSTIAGCSSSSDEGQPSAIVTMNCGRGGITVTLTSPSTGKVIDTKYFVGGSNVQTLASCGMLGGGADTYGERSAFNEDFTLLAARQPYGNDENGGWHVGVLEASDKLGTQSKFRDLSGDVDSITAPVKQSTGAFGPDGKLYAFEQGASGSALLVIDPSSGEAERRTNDVMVSDTDDDENAITEPATPDDHPYFLPGNGDVEADMYRRAVYASDGKWGFSSPKDDQVVFGDLLKKDDGKVATNDMAPFRQLNGEMSEGVRSIEPVFIVDKDRFIGTSFGGGSFFDVHVGRDGDDIAAKELYSFDENDRTSTPVVSPDGKKFSFVNTTKQGATTLYIGTFDADGGKLKLDKHAKLPDSRTEHGSDTVTLSWQ